MTDAMRSDDAPEQVTDDRVSALLAGRPDPRTDPTVLWLASAARPAPSPALSRRIGSHVRRSRRDAPGLVLRLVAVALCAAFLCQAGGNIVAGDWIAQHLGEPLGPHAYFEGALAMTAAAVCALAAAVRRSWAGVSVLTCTPLAVSLGVHGLGEIGQFAAGAALHVTEGALGVLLLAAWWWDRRDTSRSRREERV